ncbi:putative bifunctional diguanylate cyclase/phosphodiesterase [Neptunomonas marina]|uniref:Diguanylate cyclase n=1 Tax=Neptunomonas marina TaxID=1815562 RepID=A0A437QDK0_9GAMM|nr:diguanylate cyclase [Neptunomonas marina]RVU32617.1 diguanylate cyclase [Neptunomonas marina]
MYKERDLNALTDLHNAIWVYDVQKYRIHWANVQALDFWESESLDELCQRDFRENMSDAVYALLEGDLDNFRDGAVYKQWWTMFPRGIRKEAYCCFSGIELADGRAAMMVQSLVTKDLLETELSVHSAATVASLWNLDGALMSANPMFTDLYGKELDRFEALFSSAAQAKELLAAVREEGHIERELFLPTPNGGRWHNVQLRINRNSRKPLFAVRQNDITERKQTEIYHRHLAIMDPLTGLLNRYGVMKRLESLAEDQQEFSLFFLDLDNFKTINDFYGHEKGDRLLKALADRLQYRFDGAMAIARLGGDEFLLIHPDVQLADVERLGDQVLQAVREPFDITGLGMFTVTASIGAARYPQDGGAVDAILRHADAAMYQAKGHGKSRIEYFSRSMTDAIHQRQVMRSTIAKAFESRALSLQLAPLAALDGNLSSAYVGELIWHSDKLGNLSPDTFYPIAEENGMMIQLYLHQFELAREQLATWRAKGKQSQLMLKVSLRQLQNDSFVSSALQQLDEAPELAPRILLELVDADDLVDIDCAVEVMQRFSQRGVQFALGGFCSGGTPLTLLYQLPLTHIKLDKQIVDDLDKGGLPIALSLLNIASQLNLKTMAEGVSDADQEQTLKKLGCQMFYGKHIKQCMTV